MMMMMSGRRRTRIRRHVSLLVLVLLVLSQRLLFEITHALPSPSMASLLASAAPPPLSTVDVDGLMDTDSLAFHQRRWRIAILTAETRQNVSDDDAPLAAPPLLHASPEYMEFFKQNKREWAQYQGYEYIHTDIEAEFDLDTGTPSADISQSALEQTISWVKTDLLHRYMEHDDYDWVCWVDMDTLVVDLNWQLERVINEALRFRPDTDLILEGGEAFKQMDATVIKSGVMLVRASFWTRQLLQRAKEVLTDVEWAHVLDEVLSRRSPSHLDNVLTFLLSSDHSSDAHTSFAHLQDRWNQQFVYLPKVQLLHFSGCTVDEPSCLALFDRAVEHLLDTDSLYVYQAAPYVQHLYNIFAGIYVLFALDRLYHILGRYYWPNRRKSIPATDLSRLRHSQYPCVVVQLPMFNETSCCQTIIDCACKLDWPATRMYIQVVDDSTNEETKRLIDERAALWRAEGVDIEVLRRPHRQGFKAGAMNDAMLYFPEDAQFVAIFDADFLPQPHFLRQTVPSMMASPRAAFLQTRWIYTNAKESLLTRMQEISLNFHFKCEQEMRFRTRNFFNFNGTAGVWRLEAIRSSGGWHTDTLVEDMDLSLRAWACGWEFIYLNDVCVLNEIPPTFSAYLGQQHRWTSGPMQVLKKAFRTVFTSTNLGISDKCFCLWFFLRNYVHLVNFLYFLILIPFMIWIPRVTLYEWAVIYLPAVISMSTIFFTPNEWYHMVHYVLFENALCLYKTGALICGVLNLKMASQWIVTPKFARKKLDIPAPEPPRLTELPPESSVPVEDIESFPVFHHERSPDDESPDSPHELSPHKRDGSPTPSHKSHSTLFDEPSLPDLSTIEWESRSLPEVSIDMPRQRHSVSPPLPPSQLETLGTETYRVLSVAGAYAMSTLLSPTFKFLYREFFMAMFLLACGVFGCLMRQYGIGTFCLMNAFAYLLVSFSWIGRSG